MLIDSINLNNLRVFECVFRTKSMTDAAKELHLTQSGVSQHIKSLEDMLGVKLFDRISQKIVPTSAATTLFQKSSLGLQTIEHAISEIRGKEQDVSGTVTIGMPIEFGNNVVIPLLSKFGGKYPGVKFKLNLGFASAMNAGILNGAIDFAFVDEFAMDRRVAIEKVYDEVLDLCINQECLKSKNSKFDRKYFESLDYVEYQDDEPVLRMWFAHHLGTKHINLNVRATVMDVQGIARFIQNGLGAGILPHHLVLKLQKEERLKLHRFNGCGRPFKNIISVAHLSERSHSPVVRKTLDWLTTSLKIPANQPVNMRP